MNVLAHLLGASTGTPHAADDFWYGPPGTITASGVRMSPDEAQKLSAWYRGRDLLATGLAMLPLVVFARLPEDRGSDRATNHPLYDILHRKPNPWQDSFRWRRQAMHHLIDYGNAISRIVPGPRGFADQLHPIHPAHVQRVELLPSRRMLYHIQEPERPPQRLNQDEVFHVCGASDDGIWGKGILQWAAESLGTARATESYAARIFSSGTLNGGVISVPGKMDPEAAKNMARSFATSVGDWHYPKVLEQGAQWAKDDALTPERAQMLLSRKFSIDDIARWLGVPPHMIGSLDRSTNNNIEQQAQEFVDYSLGPWLALWEFAANDQLILAADRYYVEFVREALMRGDLASRWAAHVSAVQAGIKTRNEVRRTENLNALPGLDEPLTPAHITGRDAAPAAPAPRRRRRAQPADEDDDAAARQMARARGIAIRAAERLLRKEVTALQKQAVRLAGADSETWAAWVAEFYAGHVALVEATLVLERAAAEAYCASQAQQVLSTEGLAALDRWQQPWYAAGVAALAIEEAA